MRLTLSLILAVLLSSTQAHAAPPAVDQASFASSKHQVHLSNGLSMAYVETGNAKGPVLVLLHGFTDNARSWSLLLPYLDQGYRIIAPDLRGHGKSSAPECCFALSDMAHDIKLLLDDLGVEKATLVGHSLGSILTQTLAEQYPERVEKVVLISSTASTHDTTKQGSWLATEIGKLKAPIDPDSEFMINWYSNALPVAPDFIEKEKAESAAVPLQVWRGVLHELQITEFGRGLPALRVPVLILHGGKDPLFDAAAQAELRAALPAARYVEFADAGHNLFWEYPRQSAELINEFVGQSR